MSQLYKQLKLFLIRNYIMKSRNLRDLYTEIILPILFGLFILWIFKETSYIRGNQHPDLHVIQPIADTYDQNSKIYYSPICNETSNIMNKFAINSNIYPSHVVGANTEEEIVSIYNSILPDNLYSEFAMAFIFPPLCTNDKLPEDIGISIRFPGMRVPSTESSAISGGLYQSFDYKMFMSYQEAILKAVIDVRSNTTITFNNNYNDYPTYGHKVSGSYSLVSLFLVLAFIGLPTKVSSILVQEKESKVKEGMKIMGLISYIWTLGWWITYSSITLVTCIILTAILSVGGVFPYSSPILIFLPLFLYAQSIIAFSFIVSAFFDKARTAGQVAALFNLILFAPRYIISSSTPYSSTVIACFSSPIAFTQAIAAIISAESNQLGVNFNSKISNNITFGLAVFMILFDLFLYSILALYFDAIMPSEFGTPKKWYFPFTFSFWSGKEESSTNIELGYLSVGDVAAEDELIEPISEELSSKEVIKISNLKKTFDATPFWHCFKAKDQDSNIIAVNSIDLSLFEGQIFCLLGHNGAGKTTLFSMLTGMISPTAGNISIYGHDTVNGLDSIRQMLGLCPQFDILFENLTVKEHLEFYGRLKGVPDDQLNYAILEKLSEVGLEEKLDAIATSLSGGQKRKLSVCMALIGNSKVIFLDEPTSGMDPISRRKMWTLIQKYRQNRVIVLTTHFMDEADLLGDRVAIMSKGKVKCVGSPLFLKSKLGIGYHLIIEKYDKFNELTFSKLVLEIIPGSRIVSNAAKELSMIMPLSQQANFSKLFELLESEEGKKNGVRSYGVSLTTLEEVFLKIANDEAILLNRPETNQDALMLPSDEHIVNVDTSLNNFVAELPPTSRSSILTQLDAMIRKRVLIASRDFFGLAYQYLVPFLYTIAILVVLKASSNLQHVQPPAIFMSQNYVADTILSYTMDPASKDSINLNDLNTFIQIGFPSLTSLYITPTPNSQFGYFEGLYESLLAQSGISYIATAVNTLNNNTLSFNAIGNINLGISTPIVHANMISAYYKYLNLPGSVYIIDAPLPYSFPGNVGLVVSVILMTIFFGMASVSISLGFGSAAVKEKFSKAKHIQFVMGVKPFVFWLSNLIVDFFLYCIPISICLILMLIFNETLLLGDNFPVTLVIYIVGIYSILSFNYLLGFLFDDFAKLIVVSNFFNTFCCLLLSAISMVALFFGSAEVIYCFQYLAPLLPGYCFYYGILRIGFFQVIKASTQKVFDTNYFEWKELGCTLFMTALYGTIYFSLVILIDSKVLSRIYNIILPDRDVVDPSSPPEDTDVMEEKRRVYSSPLENVSMKAIRKVFRTNEGQNNFFGPVVSTDVDPLLGTHKVAVKNFTLGISENACFGLLGPNGAGKTTVMGVLTAEVSPSKGDAFVGGINTEENTDKIFSGLGYCPQFDGLIDMLTGRDHLLMYARLKGIPEDYVPELVDRCIHSLNLQEHADKQCHKYSGGNKRKLALAISLIGAPKTILLDEPSTGVDPVARRAMWIIIAGAKRDRSIILTTHSLEEADALCDSIGIMVNGELKCLGTAQHLKSKYGQGYFMELHTFDSQEYFAKTISFVKNLVPGSEILESFNGNLKFRLPKNEFFSLARLFRETEMVRNQLKLTDYSISQTTLEQVFISFAKDQIGHENA